MRVFQPNARAYNNFWLATPQILCWLRCWSLSQNAWQPTIACLTNNFRFGGCIKIALHLRFAVTPLFSSDRNRRMYILTNKHFRDTYNMHVTFVHFNFHELLSSKSLITCLPSDRNASGITVIMKRTKILKTFVNKQPTEQLLDWNNF